MVFKRKCFLKEKVFKRKIHAADMNLIPDPRSLVAAEQLNP